MPSNKDHSLQNGSRVEHDPQNTVLFVGISKPPLYDCLIYIHLRKMILLQVFVYVLYVNFI